MSRARTLMNFELIPANVGDRHVFNRFQIAYYPPPGPIQTAPLDFHEARQSGEDFYSRDVTDVDWKLHRMF